MLGLWVKTSSKIEVPRIASRSLPGASACACFAAKNKQELGGCTLSLVCCQEVAAQLSGGEAVERYELVYNASSGVFASRVNEGSVSSRKASPNCL